MAMSHMRMLFNELEGYEADIIRSGPLIMFCDSASAIAIVNSDKDKKAYVTVNADYFSCDNCV